MPNTSPTIDDAPGLRSVRDAAARDAHVTGGLLQDAVRELPAGLVLGPVAARLDAHLAGGGAPGPARGGAAAGGGGAPSTAVRSARGS